MNSSSNIRVFLSLCSCAWWRPCLHQSPSIRLSLPFDRQPKLPLKSITSSLSPVPILPTRSGCGSFVTVSFSRTNNIIPNTMSEKAELQVIPSDKRLSDSVESLESIDHALEKKVIRKCDIHLVPILFLLFLCAFVDRPVPQLPSIYSHY